MKKISQLSKMFALTLVLVIAGSVNALKAQEINYKIASLFVYSFAKYVEWPAAAADGDFVIGVYGNSPIIEELKKVAETKKIGGRNIVVKKLNGPNESANCHILFVAAKQSGEISTIADYVKNSSTLIVTEKTGMAKKGGMINLYVNEDDDKTKFEINKAQIEKNKLKVASELLRLGIVV